MPHLPLYRSFLSTLLSIGAASAIVGSASAQLPPSPATAPKAIAGALAAGDVYIPADSGVVNVRDAKYGAVGDGVTDDTAAIQKALSESLYSHRIVYLPNGTYLVSDTLKWNSGRPEDPVRGWGPFLQLQGQSRNGTIIKLKDGAEGFDNPRQPKAVIKTGSSGSHGNKGYTDGEGNEAFENHLRDFTVDVGSNNPGAVGVDYQVSNCGAMRRVTIKSSDPSGAGFSGITLERRDNGPGLIKQVSIEGFRFAVRIQNLVSTMNLEEISCRNQTETAVFVRDSILNIENLETSGAVPAIRVAGNAMLTLLDSRLTGTDPKVPAFETGGTQFRYFLRNITWSGFSTLIANNDTKHPSPLPFLTSTDPITKDGKPFKGVSSWRFLPVKGTPEIPSVAPAEWVFVGKTSGKDDSDAIQAALNSGKSHLYFAAGRYFVNRTMMVPPTVKAIIGFGSEVTGGPALNAKKDPFFMVKGGNANDPFFTDRFSMGSENCVWVFHDSPRPVVISDVMAFGSRVYKAATGAGDLFVENVAGAGYELVRGQSVWGRQWNIEGDGNPRVLNQGADVWALGFKMEGGGTTSVFRSESGKMELLGGKLYTFGVEPKTPAFWIESGSLVLSVGCITFVPNGTFETVVAVGKTPRAVLLRSEAAPRDAGYAVPAFFLP